MKWTKNLFVILLILFYIPISFSLPDIEINDLEAFNVKVENPDILISQSHNYIIRKQDISQISEFSYKLSGKHSCNVYFSGAAGSQDFFNNLDNSNVDVYINGQEAVFLPYEIFIQDAKKEDFSFSIIDKCDRHVAGYVDGELIFTETGSLCKDTSVANKSIITKHDGYFDFCHYKIIINEIPLSSYVKEESFLRKEVKVPYSPPRESSSNVIRIEIEDKDKEIFSYTPKSYISYNDKNKVEWSSKGQIGISPSIIYGITWTDFFVSVFDSLFFKIITSLLALYGLYDLFIRYKGSTKEKFTKYFNNVRNKKKK